MSEDTSILVDEAIISKVAEMFKPPTDLLVSDTLKEDAKNLYALALEENPEDPIGWIQLFNSMQPLDFQYGDATTRAGVLHQLGLTTKAMRKKQLEQYQAQRDLGKIIREGGE